MKKIRTTQIPNHARDLYIQLYCEKKGGETNESIHNATHSWLSLSLTKKRHFYNTLSNKSVVQKAQRIIQTKPFLKAKDPHKFSKVQDRNSNQQNENPGPESSPSDVNLIQHDEMECDVTDNSFVNNENSRNGSLPCSSPGPVNPVPEESEEENGSEETQSEPQISEAPEHTSHMREIDENTNPSIENDTYSNQSENIMPIEPIVPIVKNGKELYELLSSRKGTNYVAYESLTTREKRFYGNAVCRIKREFVTNYKAFLKSLTSRQLFDYYSNMF